MLFVVIEAPHVIFLYVVHMRVSSLPPSLSFSFVASSRYYWCSICKEGTPLSPINITLLYYGFLLLITLSSSISTLLLSVLSSLIILGGLPTSPLSIYTGLYFRTGPGKSSQTSQVAE